MFHEEHKTSEIRTRGDVSASKHVNPRASQEGNRYATGLAFPLY